MIASLVMFLLSVGGDHLYTSTREITDIRLGDNGVVAASTTGGILVRSSEGTWRKFTTKDGLPSNHADLFGISGDKLSIYWNHRLLIQTDTGWAPPTSRRRHPVRFGRPDVRVDWQGDIVTLSAQALKATNRTIALPAGSKGTHFTALASNGRILWAGVYGDGIWTYDAKAWARLPHPANFDLSDVTVLVRQPGTLWIGTRRKGIYELAGTTWRQHVLPDEPAAHEVHSMAWHDGRLFVATANDGIVSYDGRTWQQATKPSITSNSPTALIGFGNGLFVSQGASGVDGMADGAWQPKIFADVLPKRGAFASARDEGRMYLAQGGGWSEFDGSNWTPHLGMPDLEGLVPTCLQPDGDNLWIGTQRKGLGLFSRDSGKLTWFDERAGFEDDWVTCLCRVGTRIYAGTFVGGCMVWDGKSWVSVPGLAKQHITAMQSDGDGGVFVSTLEKLWHWDGTKLTDLSALHPVVTGGIYSLVNSPLGLWVGTSDGIYRLAITH